MFAHVSIGKCTVSYSLIIVSLTMWASYRMVVAALSMIAYGHKVTSDDDELVTQMERVGVYTSELGSGGATIIDFFPFRTSSQLSVTLLIVNPIVVKYVPTWLPGTGYLRYLAEAKEQTHLAFVTPVNIVKKEMVLIFLSC